MAVDLNYGVGVEGKNLVLKTLGRVYVKVKDRKYELLFRPEDIQNVIKEGNANSEDLTNGTSVYFINSALDLPNLEYPGDGCLIVSKDGSFYFTENNNYTQIPLSFNVDELTLTDLNVSNQITFTGSEAPLVVPQPIWIQNLNADQLDGYHANAFGIKTNSESISGTWTFNNLNFKKAIASDIIQNIDGSILIDFTTGTITCKEIIAENLKEDEPKVYNSVSGIGNEVWIGSEIDILEYDFTEYAYEHDIVNLMNRAYENKYLDSNPDRNVTWTLEDFWYPLFFSTYNFDTDEYILRDFSDQSVIDEANAKLSPYHTLSEYTFFILALQTGDISNFTGNYYKLIIDENVPFDMVLQNMIIKDNSGNIGVIVKRIGINVIIKMIDENSFLSGSKFVIIGFITRPTGICLNAKDPSLSILKNVLDTNNPSIYFGELSKIDNTKSGIGMILSGTYPTNLVADNNLDNIKNYQHTAEVNIDNPYIKWGDHVTTLNEDGSGLLSHGQIRWSSNNDLVVDGSDVTNSRIDNTGITNSSFQSGNVIINTDGSGSIGDKIEFDTTTVTKNTPMGPAGGDLSGDYPNPTIKDGVITSSKLANDPVTTDKIANGAVTEAKLDSAIINRLNTIEADVDNLQSDVTTIKEDIVEINTDITDIQTQLDQIDQKIQEQLEPLIQDVEDLKTTVSEQGNSISSLSTSLNNLSDTVTSHDQSITMINESITTLNDTVTSHSQSIENINESITTLTDSIDSVDTDLTALTTRVTTLEDTVGTLNTLLENRLNGN